MAYLLSIQTPVVRLQCKVLFATNVQTCALDLFDVRLVLEGCDYFFDFCWLDLCAEDGLEYLLFEKMQRLWQLRSVHGGMMSERGVLFLIIL